MHACCRIPVRIRRDRTERRLETCSSVPAVSCRLRPCPADSAMGRRRGHVCGHDLLAERPVPAGARICKRTGGVPGVYMAERCAPGGGIEPPWARTRRSLRPLPFHLDKSGAGGAHCRRTCLPGVFRSVPHRPPAVRGTLADFKASAWDAPTGGVYGRRPTGRREVWEQSIYPIQDIMVLQLHTGTVE